MTQMAAVTEIVLKSAAAIGVVTGLALAGCSTPPTGSGPGTISTGACTTTTTASASYNSGWAPNSAFGGMAVYYPRDSQSYGGVVVLPGFISPVSMIAAWGPFFATKNMAAFLIDPPTPL